MLFLLLVVVLWYVRVCMLTAHVSQGRRELRLLGPDGEDVVTCVHV